MRCPTSFHLTHICNMLTACSLHRQDTTVFRFEYRFSMAVMLNFARENLTSNNNWLFKPLAVNKHSMYGLPTVVPDAKQVGGSITRS